MSDTDDLIKRNAIEKLARTIYETDITLALVDDFPCAFNITGDDAPNLTLSTEYRDVPLSLKASNYELASEIARGYRERLSK